MAKIARRSVASNPSSLTSSSTSSISNSNLIANDSSEIFDHREVIASNSTTTTNSTTTATAGTRATKLFETITSTTPDPLRSNGHQLSTRTISHNLYNYNHHENNNNIINSTSAVHSVSSTNNNNNISKSFDNINTNSSAIPSTKSTTTTATTKISQNFNITKNLLDAEKERIKLEFYATYDVMTGVRIAATLGGFFGLMVFLIVYKSRSHSNETLKVLKDPKIAAVAAACIQEEEERKIQEAIEATGLSIFPDEYDTMLYRRQRMLSVGNVSAPPILHRGFRFSSVGGGGYSSLLEPPTRRYSYTDSRRKSTSESSRILSAYPMGNSFGTDDYFMETDDELENEEFEQLNGRDKTEMLPTHGYLEVPIAGQESRRSSAMTCCSTESSYLERRCSALTLGLTSLPSTFEETSKRRRSSNDIWDYYHPDIQVISATPKSSPAPSERSLYEKPKAIERTTTTSVSDNIPYSSTVDGILENGSSNGKNSITEQIVADKQQQLPLYGNSISPTLDSKSYHENRSKNYADNNELRLVVKRKVSDPSSINNNNNNNSYSSNICNSSHRYSTQYPNDDIRRAPLASISSFKISSIDFQDSDLKSLGSDSIFVESYADTDDDMEQFSTDSDEISIGGDREELEGEAAVGKKDEKSSTATDGHHSKQNQFNDRAILKSQFSRLRKDDIQRSRIKRNRPILERHRTISATTNDRIMLISQQSQEQPLVEEDLHSLRDPELNRASKYPDFISSPPSLSRRDLRTSSLPTDKATIKTTTHPMTATTTPSRQHTEMQQQQQQTPTTSFRYDNNNDSYSSSSKRNSSNKDIIKINSKSKENNSSSGNSNNECVEVNVIIENRPTTNAINPSVILELPVIALPSQDDEDPPRDPSLPGTSRKWSKETLF